MQNSSPEVRMLHFLATDPGGNKVAKAITTEFGVKYRVSKCCINISHTPDQPLRCFGNFGFYAEANHRQKSGFHSEFKPDDPSDVNSSSDFFGWNPTRTFFAAKMKIGNVLIGTIYLQLQRPLEHELLQEFESMMAQLVKPLGLFFKHAPVLSLVEEVGEELEEAEATPTALALTERQQEILARVATGRKPAKIASNLGYAASNIKQTTEEIFNALSEDDRRNAAMRAIALGLISA